MSYLSALLLGVTVLTPAVGAGARERVDLNGNWEFRMDPAQVGMEERWFSNGSPFDMTMTVPGAWNAAGAGEPSGNLFHSFSGPAWYRRKVEIPSGWKGKTIWLKFGGVHRYADVWVNGSPAGSHTAYVTPFRLDITRLVGESSGAEIVVRVDARQRPDIDPLCGCFDVMDIGPLAWGGIYRGVELEATENTWIDSVQVIPHVSRGTAEVRAEVAARDSVETEPLSVIVEVLDADGKPVVQGESAVTSGTNHASTSLKMPGAKLWSPQHPYLYTVRTRLLRGGTEIDALTDRFGMREISVKGKDFMLNGRPIFLRGYGDDCIFPNTVAPPASKAEYYRRFSAARDYGFNYVRHHSWFPLAEYFDVADELGIMLQPEFPIAYETNYDPGTPERRKLYLDAWRELIRTHWNHPSIITWCMGNELWNGHELGPEMYRVAKETDPTRLVIDSDGIPLPQPGANARDTIDFQTILFDELTQFGLNDGKYEHGLKPTKPVVVHEMGNFATLPHLSQLDLFGSGIRPFWLESIRDTLGKKSLTDAYPAWVENSNKLQAAALKANIESARLSSDISGYDQWLLQDYWNGSNGVLDMFYRPKALSAEEFRRFNSPTVLLIDSPQRCFTSGETVTIKILASRYEDAPSQDAVLRWTLSSNQKALASGTERGLSITADGVQPLREIRVHMPVVSRGEKPTLSAELEDVGQRTRNSWDLWVYPSERLKSSGKTVCISGLSKVCGLYPWARTIHDEGGLTGCDLLVTSQMDTQMIDYVERGGRVLMLSADKLFRTVPSSYRPCWWLGDAQADSNTGTVIDTTHPALDGMPNEGWCDLNFANLLTGSRAVLLDDLPVRVDPTIRCLDVHGVLRNKAYLFEVSVGRGKLLVSSMNFSDSIRKGDPSATYLLDRLVRYALGPSFAPTTPLPVEYLHRMLDQIPHPPSAPRVNGFESISGGSNIEETYMSHRDPSHRAWIARLTDGKQRVEWRTAPVGSKSGRVTLMWTGAMGYLSQPEGSFAMHLNGKPLLQFDVTLAPKKWTSADGQAELLFDVKTSNSQDAAGVMYLTVPGESLQPGKPAVLTVTGSDSSSRRWFMIFDYRDTVEYEE